MLRPIDMTITVQRTADLNRSQTGQNQSPMVQHQHFADHLKKLADRAEQQVNETEKKSEESAVDKDGKGGNEYQGNKKGKQQKEEEKAVLRKVSSSMFDVSI